MSIIRVAARGQFLVMDHNAASDLSISWEAKGLHTYLLSRPDDWKVSPDHLAQSGPAGRDKVYRMIKELIGRGYAKRNAIRDATGRIVDHEYVIYETPLTEIPEVVKFKQLPEKTEVDETTNCGKQLPLTENTEVAPLPEKPDLVNPDTAFQDGLLSNDINLVLNKPITPQQQCARETAANVPRETQRPACQSFMLTLDWMPNRERLEAMLLRAGIPPDNPFAKSWEDTLPEFLLYWVEQPDHLRQSQWEGKFLRQLQYKIREAESRPSITKMTADWKPSGDFWRLLDHHKIDHDFARDLVPEFVLFWTEAGGAALSWNAKLLTNVKAQWARRQPVRKSSLETLTDRSWAAGMFAESTALEHHA